MFGGIEEQALGVIRSVFPPLFPFRGERAGRNSIFGAEKTAEIAGQLFVSVDIQVIQTGKIFGEIDPCLLIILLQIEVLISVFLNDFPRAVGTLVPGIELFAHLVRKAHKQNGQIVVPAELEKIPQAFFVFRQKLPGRIVILQIRDRIFGERSHRGGQNTAL